MLSNKFFIYHKVTENKILKKYYDRKLSPSEQKYFEGILKNTRKLILESTKTLDEIVNDYAKLNYFGLNFGYYILKELETSLGDNEIYQRYLKAIMIIMREG